MPLRRLDHVTGLVHQAAGDPKTPPILYLPGVHGDWTPQVSVRPILSRDFHFVETAYPRIENWSIDDYAGALNDLLGGLGIESTHIVGESFGSLVAWQFGIANPARHRATGDAESTALVLIELLEIARERFGLATVGDLMDLQERPARRRKRRARPY